MADHAFLSASAGDRWLHCPPSTMLCAQEEDLGSPYAQEGSDAHALCEFLLNQALGREAADPIGNFTWYNAEMQEAAEGYVSWVLDQVAEAKTLCNDPLTGSVKTFPQAVLRNPLLTGRPEFRGIAYKQIVPCRLLHEDLAFLLPFV